MNDMLGRAVRGVFFGVVLLAAASVAAQDRRGCNGAFDECRDRARGDHQTCVTSCPRNGRACQTTCRSDLDLAIAGCTADRDGCEECHRECDGSGRRCESRARDGAQRCTLGCGRAFVADVHACTQRRAGLGFVLPCLQEALLAAAGCRGECRSVRAHDLGLCADLGDGCHEICEPHHIFPDFGSYGTLSNFSIRNEVHLGCARRYPGAYPEGCTSPAPFERAPWARTPLTEFVDAPWLATRFLVRHDGARAAVTFSAIEAQNLSENHLDARSPIIVRVLVDDQVIEPAEVRISHTALASGGAFTFVSPALGEGIHIARLQWRVEPDPLSNDDPIGLLRTGTLMVRTGLLINPEGDAGPTLALAAESPDEADVLLAGGDTGPWTAITEADGVTPLSVDFLVPVDGNIAVTFSAEVQASHFAALDVRARLASGSFDADQVMYAQSLAAPLAAVVEPPPVSGFASRSWTFTTSSLKPGWNTVEFDWRYRFREGLVGGEPDGIQSVAMQNRTVAVAATSRKDAFSRIEFAIPPATAEDVVASTDWTEIADLARTISVPENAQVAVTFDGEITATNLVLLRLLLDGAPVPDSEVTLGQSYDAQGALTHTWALKHLRAATYTIGVEWMVSGNGAAASLANRNLVLAIEELPVPDLGDGPDVGRAAGSNTTVEHPIEPVQGERRALIVIVDPQRPQVDGLVISDTPDGPYSVVINGQSHDFTASGNSAAEIRDGLIDAINAGGQPVTAEAYSPNVDGALAALRVVADTLGADQFTLTVSSPDDESLARCPSGAGCHNAPVPDPAQIWEMAFGEFQSAADFWEVNSAGRIHLLPAGPGVIGPYTPAFTGLEAIDHYWAGNSLHTCDDQALDQTYASGHGERIEQGLVAAAASGDFDFAAWDANRDGILDASELSIVVVTPQASNGGSAFDPFFKPYCDADRAVELGSVEMRGYISVYAGNGQRLGDHVTLAHELGHFPMGMDDVYTGDDTDPWNLSAMSFSSNSTWQHLDGFQKLALGWVTPRIIRVPGSYELEDVKTGGQVLILPRLDSLGREYFLIENRQSFPDGDDHYDTGLGDSGLALYHVVEPTYDGAFACQTASPAAPDCLLMSPEQCVLGGFGDADRNHIRRALRLLRPSTFASTDGSAALWTATQGSITDAAAVCTNTYPVPGLVWADGTPSGYTVGPLPAAGEVMAFDVDIAP